MVYSEADACLRFRFISSSPDAVLTVVLTLVIAALVQTLLTNCWAKL